MRISSLLLVAIIGAGLYYWFAMRAPEQTDDAAASAGAVTIAAGDRVPDTVPVMVFASTAEETIDLLTLRARTTANRFVTVHAETAGLVSSEPLRKGTRVAEGELLCKLDYGARKAQLAEAEARFAEALVEAEAATTLSKKGFASETTRMARDAQLQAAKAAVDLVKLDLERLAITAPFPGILEDDTAEIGSRLGVGDTCARIIDLSSIKVTGFASEQVVDKIYLGQTVRVRLINGREASGLISFISTMADADTRTYEIEATIQNPDEQIRDGMTAEMLIELPTEKAHLIPQSALTLDDRGTLGVRLAENDIARFRSVRVLRDEELGVWVAGLPDEALIIVVGQEFVRDGRGVAPTVVTWADLGRT